MLAASIALPSYVHFLESDFLMINLPEIAVFLGRKVVKMLSLATMVIIFQRCTDRNKRLSPIISLQM